MLRKNLPVLLAFLKKSKLSVFLKMPKEPADFILSYDVSCAAFFNVLFRQLQLYFPL